MNEKAPSYVPPNAAVCWVDERYVYVATPMGFEQYIQTFPLTEAGLHKALSLLKSRYAALPHGMVFTPMSVRPPPKPRPKPKEPVGTPAQQARALEILRKRGLIP
jgi:hypothetical protein